jgi:hypothetical protein
MDEDVVGAFDDAVAVHPDVVTVAVAPIAVDPDATLASDFRLLDDDDVLRGRRRLRGCCDRLRLLDDDHGLPVDLLRRPAFGFDHHVGLRVAGRARLSASPVAIVRDV